MSRCHQCQRDPDEWDRALRNATTERDRLRECNESMRDAMRDLREMVAMPAEGEGAVLNAVAQTLRKTLLYSSENARLRAAMNDAAKLIDGEISQWLDHRSRAYPALRTAFERLVNAMEDIR